MSYPLVFPRNCPESLECGWNFGKLRQNSHTSHPGLLVPTCLGMAKIPQKIDRNRRNVAGAFPGGKNRDLFPHSPVIPIFPGIFWDGTSSPIPNVASRIQSKDNPWEFQILNISPRVWFIPKNPGILPNIFPPRIFLSFSRSRMGGK